VGWGWVPRGRRGDFFFCLHVCPFSACRRHADAKSVEAKLRAAKWILRTSAEETRSGKRRLRIPMPGRAIRKWGRQLNDDAVRGPRLTFLLWPVRIGWYGCAGSGLGGDGGSCGAGQGRARQGACM
jgi:hypothetical protein